MIRGFFADRFGFVVAFVELPRLSLTGFVWFLVDTGSETSLVSPNDAGILGVQHNLHFQEQLITTSTGIGGAAHEYLEAALLTFVHSDGTLESIAIQSLGITVPNETNSTMPSILGLDVLRHFRLVFEPLGRLLQLEENLDAGYDL